LLLVNGIRVSKAFFLLNVEPLEEAVEVKVFEVIRAERKFSNDKFDILVLKLQLLEHGDKLFFRNSIFAIFDVLEGRLQFVRVGACHFSNPHDHFLFLALFHQFKVIHDFPQFANQHAVSKHFILIDVLLFVAVGKEYFGVLGGQVEGLVDQHVAQIGI